MASTHTTASCPTCDTTFRVPVCRDEDDAYAALELKPCGACGALLCACCEQFQCDGCAATFCTSHLVSIPDGTLNPLRCCATCAAEVEVIELPLAPLVCACCSQVIGFRDNLTSDGENIWLTAHFNVSQERLRIAAQEYDELMESAPVTPKAMGTAVKVAGAQAKEVA
jgi:hypothetical protein